MPRAPLISAVLMLGIALVGCDEIAAAVSPATRVPQDVISIIHAIDAGDRSELRHLLEAGAMPTPEGSPLSPLRAAITHFRDGALVCDPTALKLMLDHGADPNFVDAYSGFAPLESALSIGDIECAGLLKAAGADVNRHGTSGQTMLDFAVKGVLRTGDTGVVKLVFSWGVNPNVRGAHKYAGTGLHEAVGSNWGAVDEGPLIAELLRSGTDPCFVDAGGSTALDLAIERKRPAIESMLAEAMRTCPKRTKPKGRSTFTLWE